MAQDQHVAASRGRSFFAAASGGDAALGFTAARRNVAADRRGVPARLVCLAGASSHEEANLALACKEYCPDLSIVAKYDGFMPDEMKPQVGMELNVPLQRGRRSAAVREASERLQQRRAEFQDRFDQVQLEVQSALAPRLRVNKPFVCTRKRYFRRRSEALNPPWPITRVEGSTSSAFSTPSGKSTRSAKCTIKRLPSTTVAWPNSIWLWADRFA